MSKVDRPDLIRQFNLTKLRAMLVAPVLAALTISFSLVLPKAFALEILALLLSAIAAVYVGFALSDGRIKLILIEAGVALTFLVVSALGLQISSLFLAAGYFIHGGWDSLHHPSGIQTKITGWYPPFCLIYDWLLAIFIILWFSTSF